jgi:flagellar biosynthesis protein FliQ
MTNDLDIAVEIGRQALWITLKVSFAPLMIGLIVGVIISIFQAATQVQEQTLTFVPKMFAVTITIFILLPWLLGILVEYTEELMQVWMLEWK